MPVKEGKKGVLLLLFPLNGSWIKSSTFSFGLSRTLLPFFCIFDSKNFFTFHKCKVVNTLTQ